MKRLILALAMVVMVSPASYAEWISVGETGGINVYMDDERIRKQGGYVYWWDSHDYPKRTDYGDLSSQGYRQGDCKLFRYKTLDLIFYKGPMGTGASERVNTDNPKWEYAPPNSIIEDQLKFACSR